ncbi:MAG: monovalent cation/H(+) antiporter subunit G [Synergistaceae bacterium]|nr:monovalent cation/H(+) antiporter subunit G [Synergistaceae bacterium]
MIRFSIAAFLILSGLFVLGVATVGIFRFSTMLNRVHVAAKCDTLGALLALSGLMVLSGLTLFSLKLLLVILFLWLSNPVASHLVARAEVQTNHDLDRFCDRLELDDEGNLQEVE